MKVILNNQELELEDAASLAELLETASIDLNGRFALAINEEVIPKSDWSTKKLVSNDRVLVVKAVKGG